MKTKNWEDPIAAEVSKAKDQIAANFNYDAAAMFRDAQKREKNSQHKLISLPSSKAKTSHKGRADAHTRLK